jgi:hypothetical protein
MLMRKLILLQMWGKDQKALPSLQQGETQEDSENGERSKQKIQEDPT